MKTYKQKAMHFERELALLQDKYEDLTIEYRQLINNKLDLKDAGFMPHLIAFLEDLRKQGGAYSSAKAVEFLFYIGKL